MAYTYVWKNLVDMCKPFIKNVPIEDPASNVAKMACDFVASNMAAAYPFKEEVQTIATGTIPLLDGIQDYDVPVNLFRLLRARIIRTDITPNYIRELSVVESQAPDLVTRSLYAISSISHEQGVGRLRIECAVGLPSTVTAELQGEYQINPSRVANLTDPCWFDDKYAPVAQEGLLYYFFNMNSETRERAGAVQTDGKGHVAYTGQLGKFHAALWNMRVAEGWSDDEQMFPAEPLGISRDTWYPNIFGN